jgi:hypothetical protein
MDAATGERFSFERGPFPRYWIELPRGVSCHLELKGSEGENFGGATRDPFTEADVPAVAVACADRAKAKHYPYVE